MKHDVSTFIEQEWAHLHGLYPDLYDDLEKAIYAQATKLGEEAGELNEAILAHFSRQRKSKSHKETDVAEEMADVILVVMLMAQGLGIDVEQAIQQKMTKILARRSTDQSSTETEL